MSIITVKVVKKGFLDSVGWNRGWMRYIVNDRKKQIAEFWHNVNETHTLPHGWRPLFTQCTINPKTTVKGRAELAKYESYTKVEILFDVTYVDRDKAFVYE